jgi:IMP cyclohydrolase
MYVGRIVSVARTADGRLCGMYRVSSRSFPNRCGVVQDDRASIVPKPGHEADIQKNPYIAYNCVRLLGTKAVVSNGSHTDILADKISIGMPPRDTLINVLSIMDYEHDALDTPRIAAIIDSATNESWIGIVTNSSLIVRKVELAPGEAAYVATYEHQDAGAYRDNAFSADSAENACTYILGQGVFADLERPVTAVCAVATGDSYEVAVEEAAL